MHTLILIKSWRNCFLFFLNNEHIEIIQAKVEMFTSNWDWCPVEIIYVNWRVLLWEISQDIMLRKYMSLKDNHTCILRKEWSHKHKKKKFVACTLQSVMALWLSKQPYKEQEKPQNYYNLVEMKNRGHNKPLGNHCRESGFT